jgi:CheY-like chemotaxis protein
VQHFVNRALFDRMAADALTGAQHFAARFSPVAAQASARAQRLVNPARINRLAAEAFTGARARFYLLALLALALAVATDLAAASIWLGGVLLVDATRAVLAAHLPEFSRTQASAARLALDLSMNACLAAAPALAWFAPGELSAALATAMLSLLLSHAAFSAQHGRLHALLACAPYALLGFLLVLDAVHVAEFAPIAACLVCLAYVAGATLHHVHRASHLRAQDAEWVRQLNMTYGEGVAGWELDYARGKLFGADRLSALLGRSVDYADIIVRGCFAAPEDRPLVKAAFAPPHGPAHRIAVEHEAVRADGSRVRLRHTGFIRTTPDGEPVRLTCVTRLIDAMAEPMAEPGRADAGEALDVAAAIDDIQGAADAPLVVVIEDDAEARQLAARALTRAGFSVLCVGGGEAGLALARAKAPALILLDIFLADRSGWRVLERLQHDVKTRDIPVVVLSLSEDRAEALALGAAEHIVKPADRDRLAATVMRYARKRPAPAPQTLPALHTHKQAS